MGLPEQSIEQKFRLNEEKGILDNGEEKMNNRYRTKVNRGSCARHIASNRNKDICCDCIIT